MVPCITILQDSSSDWAICHSRKVEVERRGRKTIYSAIHKAAGLMVPSHSMTLPGTISENLLHHEWGWQLEWSLRSFQPLAEC